MCVGSIDDGDDSFVREVTMSKCGKRERERLEDDAGLGERMSRVRGSERRSGTGLGFLWGALSSSLFSQL